MSGQLRLNRVQAETKRCSANVVHIYQVRPEMALEHLRRSTGLDFDPMPNNLARENTRGKTDAFEAGEPPLLTDIVDGR